MTCPPPALEELRRAIDAVDDGLFDLVVRRGELVAEVGRGKTTADAPIDRPARESQVMRRLLARRSDSGAMWREVFLTNKDAVLELLGRFNEGLSVIQRSIRKGDGATLFDKFTRTRAIRRSIVHANHA